MLLLDTLFWVNVYYTRPVVGHVVCAGNIESLGLALRAISLHRHTFANSFPFPAR